MLKKSLMTLLATSGVLLSSPVMPEVVLAQQVLNVIPAQSSINVPQYSSVSGEFFAGNGPAVDTNSVRIFVNNQDVTDRSTITRTFFSHRPPQPLPPGQNQVRVEYRNVLGEFRSVGWTFTVQPPAPAAQITSVTHNAINTPLNTGSTLSVTINGTPGAQASVLLVLDSRTVREIPARETSSGIYVATLPIQAGDRTNEGIVIARLSRQNQPSYGAASFPVVLNAGSPSTPTQPGGGPGTPGTPGTNAPLQPRFTSHQDGGLASRNGFTLVGQTRPNATVQVRVTVGIVVLGVNIGGQTVVDQEVRADQNGQFQVQVPPPPTQSAGLRYRVRAVAREGNEVSPVTEIRLRQ